MSLTPAANLSPVSTTLVKLVAKFAGVLDTGGKFATGVVDTGGNFAVGVGCHLRDVHCLWVINPAAANAAYLFSVSAPIAAS